MEKDMFVKTLAQELIQVAVPIIANLASELYDKAMTKEVEKPKPVVHATRFKSPKRIPKDTNRLTQNDIIWIHNNYMHMRANGEMLNGTVCTNIKDFAVICNEKFGFQKNYSTYATYGLYGLNAVKDIERIPVGKEHRYSYPTEK